jgi:hypothetical protein
MGQAKPKISTKIVDTLPPEESNITAEDRAIFPTDARPYVIKAQNGRLGALMLDPKANQWNRLAWAEPGGEMIEFSDLPVLNSEGKLEVGAFDIAPDGRSVLVIRKYDKLYELALPSLSVQHVFPNTAPGLLMYLGFLGADDLLVLWERMVIWYKRDGDGWCEVSTLKTAKASYMMTVEAHGCAVILTGAKYPAQLIATVGDKLKLVQNFSEPTDSYALRGDRVFLRKGKVSREILGLKEVLADLRAKAKPKAAKAKAKAAKTMKLSLAKVDRGEVPLVSAEVIKRLGLEDTEALRRGTSPRTEVRVSARGDVEVGIGREGNWKLTKLRVFIAGKLFVLDVRDRNFSGADISPDGKTLFITAFDGLYVSNIDQNGFGELSHMSEPSGKLFNVVALAGGLVVLKNTTHLRLFRHEGKGTLKFLHQSPLKWTYALIPIPKLNAFIAYGEDSKKRAWIGGVSKDKLKVIGTFGDANYDNCVVQDQRAWLTARKNEAWEIEGLAETAAAKKLEQS